MGKIIQLPMSNIKKATTEQLKYEWDKWYEVGDEIKPKGVDFYYEDIHMELNMRGEGEYCTV